MDNEKILNILGNPQEYNDWVRSQFWQCGCLPEHGNIHLYRPFNACGTCGERAKLPDEPVVGNDEIRSAAIAGSIVFTTGLLLMTAGVASYFSSGFNWSPILYQHQRNISEVCEEDREVNWQAILYGGRVLSAYEIKANSLSPHKVWIITEADRHSTTILFPSEY